MKRLVLAFVLGFLTSIAVSCSLAIEGQIGEPERKPPTTNCPE